MESRLWFLPKCPCSQFEGLGPFFHASCSIEMNIQELVQLNHQIVAGFQAAGLVDLGSESLNFANASNTEKHM